ncbi:hypothetical protein [Diplocloster hominis]|uniref:hypothetical protein n=1 Tax=Diplocloster hominis TaxID=3079010 RepID=UPI0031BBC669
MRKDSICLLISILLISSCGGCTQKSISISKKPVYEDITANSTELENFKLSYQLNKSSFNLTGILNDNTSLIGVDGDCLYYENHGKIDPETGTGDIEICLIDNYTAESPGSNILFSFNGYSYWKYCGVENQKVYLGLIGSNTVEKGTDIKIMELSKSGNKTLYQSSHEEPVYAYHLTAMPGYLLLSYETDSHCFLKTICMDDGLVSLIEETACSFDQETSMASGSFIIGAGSMDKDGFYYEVLTLDHELLDTGGSSSIYYYSLKDQNKSFVLQPERKSLFLSGDSHHIIQSEYDFYDGSRESGKIYKRIGNDIYPSTISQIIQGNNIIGAKHAGEANRYIVLYTPFYFYIFDTVDSVYETIPYYSYDLLDQGFRSLGFCLSDSQMFYLQDEGGSILLYKWELSYN